MKFKAVLFDLDGTLLDTLEDLADSMNSALSAMGMPTHALEKYNYFVGDGMETLASRALPSEQRNIDQISRCVGLMKREYDKRWARKTVLYDGVTELLDELKKMNISMVILSNKAHEFTEKVVEHFFGLDTFSVVLGAGAFPVKPDPSAARFISQKLTIPENYFLYVGDTNTDMETAIAAGMYPLGALWGFRTAEELNASGAQALVSSPAEILRFFQD